MRKFARLVNGAVRMMGYQEAWKYAFRRNPELRVADGFRVQVPQGTKNVYIPRRKHYAKTVLTEQKDENRLHEVGDILEPCIVNRGTFGFGLHECNYHRVDGPMGPVFIEEINAPAT